MVIKGKGTRVFVYAKCFSEEWCDRKNIPYDKKLSGVVQRKFNKSAIVKMDIDGADEEVDLEDVNFGGDGSGKDDSEDEVVSSPQRKRKRTDNSEVEFHGVLMSENNASELRGELRVDMSSHSLLKHDVVFIGTYKRRPRYTCVHCKSNRVSTYC
eukprot:Pgem_evm1s4614